MAEKKKKKSAGNPVRRKPGASVRSTGTAKKASGVTRAASGTAGKGKSAKRTSPARNKTDTRQAAAREKAIQIRAQKEREIRMDVALICLLVMTAFVFLSLLGFGGSVGRTLSNILFGFFGIGAWILPAYVFIYCLLVLSKKGGRDRFRRMMALLLLIFVIQTAAHLKLHFYGTKLIEAPFDPLAVFNSCMKNHAGGGIPGGAFAWFLNRAFGPVVGTVLLAGLGVIGIVLAFQLPLTGMMRKLIETRKEEDRPGYFEQRAQYRQMRLEELEREKEEELERQTQRILRREDAQLRRQAAREERQARLSSVKKRKGSDFDLEDMRLIKQDGASVRKNRHTAGGFSARDKRAGKTGPKHRDLHEITVLPQENNAALTLPSPGRQRYRDEEYHDLLDPSAAVLSNGNFDPENKVPASRSGSLNVFHERSASGDIPTGKPVSGTRSAQIPSFGDGLDVNYASGNSMEANPAFRDSMGANYAPGKSMEANPAFRDSQSGKTASSLRPAESPVPGDADYINDFPEMLFPEGTGRKKDTAPDMVPASSPESAADGVDLSDIAVHREKKPAPVNPLVRTAVPRRADAYLAPPFSLLKKGERSGTGESDNELRNTARLLEETLRTFGVQVKITDISRGPSVTRYELMPDQGVKVSRIVNLSDDIKLRLAATDIRIEAPIPGKSAIGIEVPNKSETTVRLRDLLETKEFRRFDGKLPFAVGKDIGGKTIIADIARMPHLLIAGATGSGKSVCINTIILSILYRTSPDKVRLLMIDPKVVELSVYKKVPHLIIPVVTDAKKASAALNWAVAEMEKRYRLFAAAGVRDLNGYNALAASYAKTMGRNAPTAFADNNRQDASSSADSGQYSEENALNGNSQKSATAPGMDGIPGQDPLPRLVIIVDELADLMMVAKSDVESAICRLAQLARAAGIHLIIATQRPSVDVITGLIKANMPSRIAFAVSSQVDSRTILDMAGAEKLLGKGDMLFYPQNYQKPARIQGAFVSDDEVTDVVEYIKKNNRSQAKEQADESGEIDRQIEDIAENGLPSSGSDTETRSTPGRDEYFAEAGRFIIEKNKASIGLLQRVFKIGFNRAARIMDQLAEAGVVTEESSTRARQVIMSMPEFETYLENES